MKRSAHTPRAAGRPRALLLLAALSPLPAAAQVYVGQSGSGSGATVVLSNFASDSTPTLLLQAPAADPPPEAQGAAKAEAVTPVPLRLPPPAIARLVHEASGAAGVSPLLVHAVIAAESNYDSAARSPKGALGLMQLMPATAAQFGVAEPFDPRANIVGGTQYLRWLSERLGDRVDLVLAAYNAGLASVVKAGYRVPAFPETQAYVRRILAQVACTRASDCRPSAARRA